MATLSALAECILINDGDTVFTAPISRITINDDGSVAHLWDGTKMVEYAWTDITGDAQTNYNTWTAYLEGETF